MIPEVEWLDCIIILFLLFGFWGNCHTIFHSSYTALHFANRMQGFHCLAILTTLTVFCFFFFFFFIVATWVWAGSSLWFWFLVPYDYWCCQSCSTEIPWTAARQASLFFTISWSLLKLTSVDLVMSSNHLNLCLPFFLMSSVFSSTKVFFSELALRIRWPQYWSFSFSISPSNEYSGWFPLGLTVLISLLSRGLLRVFSNTTL